MNLNDANGMLGRFVLKLYVCGLTPSSQQALANVCRLFETESEAAYDLQIVDVLERPDLAERERIMATPSLVKESPLPKESLIGDLSQISRLRSFLGFASKDGDSH